MEADDEALKVRERQGQGAAVPAGGRGSELPALPPPGGPGDSEEGRAAQGLEGAPGTDPGGVLGQTAAQGAGHG